MHDPLKWWLYDICAVHHVSTEKGQDIFMLVEKDYPLTKGLATLMLCNKLIMDQQSKMADEVNTGRPKLSTAMPKHSTDSTKIELMKLEAMVEERRIFKCWFYYHTTNGHQFTMSDIKNWLVQSKRLLWRCIVVEERCVVVDVRDSLGDDEEV
ncbi:hypothetical protein Tco_0490884 [Tanacetum coccineum]